MKEEKFYSRDVSLSQASAIAPCLATSGSFDCIWFNAPVASSTAA
jgi:hypothetical protein